MHTQEQIGVEYRVHLSYSMYQSALLDTGNLCSASQLCNFQNKRYNLFASHFVLAFNLYALVTVGSLTFSETVIMETTHENMPVYTEESIIACLKTCQQMSLEDSRKHNEQSHEIQAKQEFSLAYPGYMKCFIAKLLTAKSTYTTMKRRHTYGWLGEAL